MKHSMKIKLLLCMVLAVSSVEPASAQLMGRGKGKARPVEPAQDLPLMPEAPPPANAARPSTMPALPVSRACKQADIEGLWRLLRVYEEPIGKELTTFTSNPMQYIYYKSDGTYGKYNGGEVLTAAEQIVDHIDKHTTGLQQYLLQDTGMIYYYQDKVATTSQACFIVLKPRESFLPGEMLQIPPKGQVNGRLIKEYTKVAVAQPATPTATKDAAAAEGPVDPDHPYPGHRALQRQPVDPNDPVK